MIAMTVGAHKMRLMAENSPQAFLRGEAQSSSESTKEAIAGQTDGDC